MNFIFISIISSILSLYGIIAKRQGWIYFLNSMNNTIPMEKRVKIDWNGFANVFGNLFSILGFILVLGWLVFKLLNIINYFPILFFTVFLIVCIGGMSYGYRVFDKSLPDNKRNNGRIKFLEIYNLDIMIFSITIILIVLKILINVL